MIHNETTMQIKSALQKTKKIVFPETAEKIHISAQCRIVKHIVQRTRLEKASGEVSCGSYLNGEDGR